MWSVSFRTVPSVLAITIGLVAVCVNSACVPVTSQPDLHFSETGNCIVNRINKACVRVTNGVNNNQDCKITVWTDKPAYGYVAMDHVNFFGSETLTFKTATDSTKSITSASKYSVLFAPVSSNELSYKPDPANLSTNFRLYIMSIDSRCSQVCDMVAGDSVSITQSAYRANTYCQTWVNSPSNCIPRATIATATVGTKDSSGICDSDALVVNKRGEAAYSKSTTLLYCADDANVVVDAENSNMNILFSGKEGGAATVAATITLTCT